MQYFESTCKPIISKPKPKPKEEPPKDDQKQKNQNNGEMGDVNQGPEGEQPVVEEAGEQQPQQQDDDKVDMDLD